MFTRTLRRSLQRQEGQALVLACLMVLVLSVAVLSTVNIGHMITERVRLQNTADASAYSTAAMEARAYNFYAFSNRTQVSHYVSAMLLQTLLSVFFWFQAFLSDLFGIALTILFCSSGGNPILLALCTVAKAIPVVSQILTAIDTIMDVLRNVILNPLKTAMDPVDRVVGKVAIPGLNYINRIYSSFSFGIMAGAYTHILGSSAKVIEQNDPNVNAGASLLATGIISACAFRMTHDPAAMPGVTGVNGDNTLAPPNPWSPLDPTYLKDTGSALQQRTARAKRVMGGIANATRYAADSKGYAAWWYLQTKRGLGDLILGFLPNSLNSIRNFVNNIGDKKGQTRMLSHTFGRGRDRGTSTIYKGQGGAEIPGNYIRRRLGQNNNAPTGMLTQGDNIGADDLYLINMGPEKIGVSFVSIDNPFHCRENDDYRWCWGDPRYGKREPSTDQLVYALKPSIWALNPKETRNGTNGGGPFFQNGGVHWRLVAQRYPAQGHKQGENGNWPISDYPFGGTNIQMQGLCNSDVKRDCPDRGINVKKVKISPLGIPGFEFQKRNANVRYTEDGNHPWAGIVPFMHFEPGQFRDPCGIGRPELDQAALYEHEFNQPSTWTMLNKGPDDLKNPLADPKSKPGSNKVALLRDDGTLKFSMGSGGGTTLKMDNDQVRGLGFLPKGLNVVARGQAYYHRPGNWAEQPNFFNPYWRPRLASVFQGLNSTLNRFPAVNNMRNSLPGALTSFPQKIITH